MVLIREMNKHPLSQGGGMTIIEFGYWPDNGNDIIFDLNNAGFRSEWKPASIGIVVKWGNYIRK